MITKPRKRKINRETVKDLHTSHWDLDMLSLADLETLMGAARENSALTADTSSEKVPLMQLNTTSADPESAKPE